VVYCNLYVPDKDRKIRFGTYWWPVFLDLRMQFWFVGAILKYYNLARFSKEY
jgi:hypothetical protein